jgi:tetratricopeptide (TPR) repeat protein
LAELEEQNHSGQPMLNDTLAETLVAYFDRHGNANERMRAKYILGRTYADMGELPRALETYYQAADCADTTASDCDFAKLSRIHAQSAIIFNMQVQPRSQLRELRLAEYYAWKGLDTLQAIECYAQQADAYDLLQKYDSVIIIREKAYRQFLNARRADRASQTLGSAIPSLLKLHNIEKAQKFINLYEKNSNLFDEHGNIEKGREVYYSIKGRYFIEINEIDSAEYLFRKEISQGNDINNQIIGSKCLQEIYMRKNIPDSIVKYANLGYFLNDSAYSLSEMQNIQKFQASYNYNHHKFLAEKSSLEARIAWLVLAVSILAFALVGILFGKKYKTFKRAALDNRLIHADITRRLKDMANSDPVQYPSLEDWKGLRSLVEHEIPSFPQILGKEEHSLSDLEYDVCLMIRVHLKPLEIAKLKKCAPSYISNIRKSLLLKIFGIEGSSELFDDEIGKIGSKAAG